MIFCLTNHIKPIIVLVLESEQVYISIGEKSAIILGDIVGIFDIEETTKCLVTKQYLKNAQQQKIVKTDTGGIPRSFIVSMRNNKKEVRLSICRAYTIGGRYES